MESCITGFFNEDVSQLIRPRSNEIKIPKTDMNESFGRFHIIDEEPDYGVPLSTAELRYIDDSIEDLKAGRYRSSRPDETIEEFLEELAR